MKQTSRARSALAVLAMALALGLAATDTHAATQKGKKAAAASASGAKKAPPKKVKFVPGSQESAKDRAARLKRECKGAANAGACQGHTG